MQKNTYLHNKKSLFINFSSIALSIILGLGLLLINFFNFVSADTLHDGIDFLVASTSIREAEPSMSDNGNYQFAYSKQDGYTYLKHNRSEVDAVVSGAINSVAKYYFYNNTFIEIPSSAVVSGDSVSITPEGESSAVLFSKLYGDYNYYKIYLKSGENYLAYNNSLKANVITEFFTTESFLQNFYSENNNLSDLYYKVNEEYIPLYNEIFTNSADSNVGIKTNQEVVLSNYESKSNLELGVSNSSNIENLYVSFGDIYKTDVNEFDSVLLGLTVQVKLQNKYYPIDYYSGESAGSGIYLVVNAPIAQDPQLIGTVQRSNYFWFDYFDLENLYYYTDFDSTPTGDIKKVEHSDGLYTFTFTYNIFSVSTGITSTNTYSYSINISQDGSYSNYPTFNESILSSTSEVQAQTQNDYLTYYYNFQSQEIPTLTFDASKFNINYVYKPDSTISNSITSRFSTYLRTEQSAVETGNFETICENSLYELYENGTIFNRTKILAKLQVYVNSSDINSLISSYNGTTSLYELNGNAPTKAYKYTCTYRTKTSNFSNGDYTTSTFGNFVQKLTNLIFVYENDGTEYYLITSYISKVETDSAYGALESVVGYVSSQKAVQADATTFNLTFSNIKISASSVSQFNLIDSSLVASGDAVKNYSYTLTRDDTFSYLTYTTISGDDTITHYYNAKASSGNIDIPTALNSDSIQNLFDDEDSSTTETPEKTVYKNLDIISNYKALFLSKNYSFNYIIKLSFDDLGVYKFNINYALSVMATQKIENTASFDYLKMSVSSKNLNKIYTASYKFNGYNLEIFGVKDYFNKNGKTELKDETNGIFSDFSYTISDSTLYTNFLTNGPTSADTLTLTYNSLNNYTPKYSIAITNMPPITFDYYCSYKYTSNNVSSSKIYRYNYNKVTNTVGSLISTNYFNQNTYPNQDGYYEILIKYTYSNYAPSSTTQDFYQVFAFAIDNSSPDISLQKQVSKIDSSNLTYLSWASLNRDTYTNSKVRISWPVASYFQYEVSPTITKTNYSGIVTSGTGAVGSAEVVKAETKTTIISTTNVTYLLGDTTQNVVAGTEQLVITKYSNNYMQVPKFNIVINDGATLVERKSNLFPNDFDNANLIKTLLAYKNEGKTISYELIGYYYQIEITPTNNSSSYWGSGNYALKMNYGSTSQSYLTYKFTIDTLGISSINVCNIDIVDNSDGSTSYSISPDKFKNNGNNLINQAFTITYNKKSSGSPITASYYAIPFADLNSDAYSFILNGNLNGLSAITADIGIYDNNSNSKNTYTYDYSYSSSGDSVYGAGVFNPSGSMLYIFVVSDSAGNSAMQYVLFDKSTPNYIINTSESELVESYGIITNNTSVSWGNYKAIKITNSSINTYAKYIFNNETNANATNLAKALKNIYENQTISKYSGAKVVRAWKLADNTYQMAETYSADDIQTYGLGYSLTLDNINDLKYYQQPNGNYYITGSGADSEIMTDDIMLAKVNNEIVVDFYILIPLNTVDLSYYSTSTNSTTSNVNYSSLQTTTSNSKINFTPTKKALCQLLVDLGIANNLTTAENLITANPNKYGFYGENKYSFLISDIIGNYIGNSLWMNLDLSRAWSYGSFENLTSSLTSSNTINIFNNQLLPSSSYSSSQLYFSYLPGNGSSIPDSSVSYKFYDFMEKSDINYYSDYALSGITISNNCYNFVYKKISDLSVTFTYSVPIPDSNNLNAENEIIGEPTASYPFNLNNNDWNNVNLSGYTQGDRVFSTIINGTTSESGYIETVPGMYVFKRIYTAYLDANGNIDTTKINEIEADSKLDDDTIIKYYIYYIDRYGIVDLTNAINVGEDLNVTLGAGIGDSEYSYSYNSNQIQSKFQNSTATSSNSVKVTNSLFTTNKVLVQNNISIDKYNIYKTYYNYVETLTNSFNALSKTEKFAYLTLLYPSLNASSTLTEINTKFEDYINTYIKKYVLSTNYETFKLDVNFTMDNKKLITNNIISSELYSYLLTSKTSKNSLSNTYSNANRTALTDGILVKNNAETYIVTINDQAGITREVSSNSTSNLNYENSLQFTYSIKLSYPTGTYYGKYDNASYENDSSTTKADYCNKLFNTTDYSTLQNLSLYSSSSTTAPENIVYVSTNNDTLIFMYEKSSIPTQAQINPYVVTIEKTNSAGQTQTLFSMTNSSGELSFGDGGGATSKMANAFMESSDGTKYAIVVFDHSSSYFAGSSNSISAIGNSSENAIYCIRIQFLGEVADYSNYFYGYSTITVDNEKPLYNVLRLMYLDNYISTKTSTDTIKNILTSNTSSTTVDLSNQNKLITLYNQYILKFGFNADNYYTDDFNNKLYKTYLQNYFFAVNSSFNFEKASGFTLTDSAGLDTYNRLYFRKISDITSYKFSLMPDNFYSTTKLSSHPLFDPLQASICPSEKSSINADSAYYYYDFVYDSTTKTGKLPIQDNFESNSYYEIIERDAAGNYQTYCIYVANDNEYSLSYTPSSTSSTGTKTASLTQSSNEINIYGDNLTLSQTNVTDKYLKASITYQFVKDGTVYNNSTSPIWVYSNPVSNSIGTYINGSTLTFDSTIKNVTGDLGIEEVFLNQLKTIYSNITTNYDGASDFTIEITLYNRIGENYYINYYVPGDEIELIYSLTSNGFKMTIPDDNDNVATKLIKLVVEKRIGAQWVKQTTDLVGTSINETTLPSGNSLATLSNKSYLFGNGTYRFALTDNFGRTSYYYRTHGTDSTQTSITYLTDYSANNGKTKILNSTYYSAQVQEMVFDTSLYQAHLHFYNTSNVVTELSGISFSINQTYYLSNNYVVSTEKPSTIYATIVVVINGNTAQITITQEHNLNIHYLISLIDVTTIPENSVYSVSWLSNSNIIKTNYDFVIYTKLPELYLTNLSDAILSGNNQVFIEDVKICWGNSTDTYLFNTIVNITKTTSGVTTNFNASTNGQVISVAGTYTIKISNTLGYTSSKTLNFTRSEGNTILYSVYTKTTASVTNILSASAYKTMSSELKAESALNDDGTLIPSGNVLVYHYYALSTFNNYKTVDGVIIADTSKSHIEIVTSSTNMIGCQIIGYYITNGITNYVYKIYDTNSNYVHRYFVISFINSSSGNFANLKYKNSSSETSFITVSNSRLTSSSSAIVVGFEGTNDIFKAGYNGVTGNTIMVYHYYGLIDSVPIETFNPIYNGSNPYSITISDAGLHIFVVKDLAGNTATFGTGTNLDSKFNIYLVNGVLYTINDKQAIDGEIFNKDVYLKLITNIGNVKLYEGNEISIIVQKNGVDISDVALYSTDTYKFTDAGYYSITLNTTVQSENSNIIAIYTTLTFTIINPNTSLATFNISSGSNFKILEVKKKLENSTEIEYNELEAFKNNLSLWLSSEDEENSGDGYYEITVLGYIPQLKDYREFTFNIWINNENPTITASTTFGSATTDPIVLTYNAWGIYNKIGNSNLRINGTVIATFDSSSIDQILTYTINDKGDYWIEIFTEDGNLVASYKLTKNDPLNSTAKIVLIIVGIAAGVLITIFIIMRKRTKFR